MVARSDLKVPRMLLVSLGRTGGLPKYARAIDDALEDAGLPCIRLCATGSEHPLRDGWRVPTYRDMPTLLLSLLTALPFTLLLMTWLRLREGVRVVYFPYLHTWTPVMALWGRLLGCRVVVTFHDYRPHLGEAGRLTRLILWLCARLPQRFIFLSAHVRDEAVADRAGIRDLSTVIPHGLFSLPGLDQKSPSTLRQALRTVLFIGRISRYKGVELLMEAFQAARLPDCRLVVAGKANYRIDPATLPERVELLDRFLDEAEMAALLNQADVLALPYLEATQSGIVTLGIDSATPMLCTRVAGLAEQLTEAEALFCMPEASAMARALADIADLEARRGLCANLAARKAEMDWRRLALDVHRFCTT